MAQLKEGCLNTRMTPSAPGDVVVAQVLRRHGANKPGLAGQIGSVPEAGHPGQLQAVVAVLKSPRACRTYTRNIMLARRTGTA